ncbi:hypothetical protein [Plantactinospora sonchi]|uniref:Uncharacterized protein n=1 Tax=Plantactinospora sonchi TaxID=1544735 RepID=A0ABU7RM93_9ACTN
MRHLGSLLLGLISVPLIWVLSALGSWKLNNGLLEDSSGDRFLGFLALLGVGIILAAMLVPRISPVGPIIAGGFYLLVSFWALVHIESLAKVIPDDSVGPPGLMNVPVGTISMLVAIPLLATAASPDRWRGRARSTSAPAYPGAPGHPGQLAFPPGTQPPPGGQFPPGTQQPGQYPPGAPAGYPPNFGPSASPSHSQVAPPNFGPAAPAGYGPGTSPQNAPTPGPHYGPPGGTPGQGWATPGQPVSGAPGSAPPVPTPMPPSFAPPGPRPPTSAPPASPSGFAPPRTNADETTQFAGRPDDDGTEGPTRKLGDTRPF